MIDLMSVVDWSRAQFALTAMFHWFFVPLTLGLGIIVAVMETIYHRKRSEKWLAVTKFWMRLFGINFACGVATGIILEFEFGTNWSNYSWFVGDIFGAPLAIEGILAFFMEATFIAVMFFGWNKVSPRFHLASTWLTAIGASISALWILIANAWMQYPVGMKFNPDEMRNVMDNFWAVAFSPIAINKFFHAVMSGWALSGVVVMGICCWFLLKKRNVEMAMMSMKVGAWVGIIGLGLTMLTGDGSAVEVAKHQPMKLAAMEGLYDGTSGQKIIGFGIINPAKTIDNDEEPVLCDISVPYGLSILARHDYEAFVPGINDIIAGRDIDPETGDTINTVGYAERIERGRAAQEALRQYNAAKEAGDTAAMVAYQAALEKDYPFFGYGYFDSVEEAVPNVAMTFYAFHIMVLAGCFVMLVLLVALFALHKKPKWLSKRLLLYVGILAVPIIYICSQCGWIVAEVGRQPWTIQDILPAKAAISDMTAASVQTTFFIFLFLFCGILIAELCILFKQIRLRSRLELDDELTSSKNND